MRRMDDTQVIGRWCVGADDSVRPERFSFSFFFADRGLLSFLGERKYPKSAIQGGRDFDFIFPFCILSPTGHFLSRKKVTKERFKGRGISISLFS